MTDFDALCDFFYVRTCINSTVLMICVVWRTTPKEYSMDTSHPEVLYSYLWDMLYPIILIIIWFLTKDSCSIKCITLNDTKIHFNWFWVEWNARASLLKETFLIKEMDNICFHLLQPTLFCCFWCINQFNLISCFKFNASKD